MFRGESSQVHAREEYWPICTPGWWWWWLFVTEIQNLRSPQLSSDKCAIVFLLSSKTEYLRFSLLLIKCWYHSFLAEETADGYCKQAYSHFFYWWVTCLLHRSLTPVHAYVWECWLWVTSPRSQADCISLGRFAVQRPLPVWNKTFVELEMKHSYSVTVSHISTADMITVN